jgi:hypothetical protein
MDHLQHEHPKLGAIATANLTGADFAAMLDRAIERSGKARAIREIDFAPERPVRRRLPG